MAMAISSCTLANQTEAGSTLVNFEVYEPVFTPEDTNQNGCIYKTTLMEHVFENSYGFPFIGTHKPPPCAFNRVTMNFTVTVKGRQFDRLGIMYLGDIEVFRTSTSEPTANGIVWTYVKEMDHFNTLWKTDQKIIFDLPNNVNEIYTGLLHTTLTATFFSVPENKAVADEILPITAKGSLRNSGSVFTVPNDAAKVSYPLNGSYKRAVVSLAATGQQGEEFWYQNVLSSDVDTFKNTTGTLGGFSPFREVQLLIDGRLAGVSWPFPIIFTGGIVPGLWRPIAGIDTYDLRQDEIDVTPWLSYLVDGNEHSFEIRVVGLQDDGKGNAQLSDTVGGYWLVTGTIFLFHSATSSTSTLSRPGDLSVSDIPPEISVSSSKTTSTLTYNVEVSRAISVTSPHDGTWTQHLTFHNQGALTNAGLTQVTTQFTNGTDYSQYGYSRRFSYPLTVNSGFQSLPNNGISIDATLSRGLTLEDAGESVFPNGVQNFNIQGNALIPADTSFEQISRSANTQLPQNITAALSTTQEGSASYLSTSSKAYSFGSLAQEFTFQGKDVQPKSKTFETYKRTVNAVNSTVQHDAWSLEGETLQLPLTGGSTGPVSQLSPSLDDEEVVLRSVRAILGRGPGEPNLGFSMRFIGPILGTIQGPSGLVVSQPQHTNTAIVNTAPCAPTYTLKSSPSPSGGSSGSGTPGGDSNAGPGSTLGGNGGNTGGGLGSGNPSGSAGGSPPPSLSVTGANTSPSSTNTPSRFLIALSIDLGTRAPPPRFARKRATAQVFLKSDGDAVSNCLSSTAYSLSDAGILGAGGGAIFSVNSTVKSAPLVASRTIESIYGVWKASGNSLRWENLLFYNGAASFCYDAGNVIGYYKVPPPSDCSKVDFTIASVATCPGFGSGNASLSSTSPIASNAFPSLIPSAASIGFSATPAPSGNLSLAYPPSPTGNYSIPGTSPTLSNSYLYPYPNNTMIYPTGTGTAGSTGKNCFTISKNVYGPTHATLTATGSNCQVTILVEDPNTSDKSSPEDYSYGLSYNAYDNPGVGNKPPTTDPSVFASNLTRWRTQGIGLTLVACGTSPNVSFSTGRLLDSNQSSFGLLPGQTTITDLAFVTVIFHGFLLVPDTGDYTFTTSSNDFGFVWLGSPAYKNWDGTNAVARTGGASTSTRWNKGDKVPLTILYANAGASGNSTFTLQLPNRSTTSDFSRLFLQPSPNDQFAPAPYFSGSCPSPKPVADPYCGTKYKNFYYGAMYYIFNLADLSNLTPGQSYHALTIADGSVNVCTAVKECVAYTQGFGGKWFGLTHLASQAIWYCQAFNVTKEPRADYFSIKSRDIVMGLGYVLR
ncbi:hypothetical protein KY384_008922 [Bacidia gigantensis]|nr:hypothetical protein KY384_008922 [Bacidia gigantensis]